LLYMKVIKVHFQSLPLLSDNWPTIALCIRDERSRTMQTVVRNYVII